MRDRHLAYNETMDYLMRQVENGQAFVIPPKEKNSIGRMDRDPRKLKALYDSGYQDALACYDALLAYLEK